MIVGSSTITAGCLTHQERNDHSLSTLTHHLQHPGTVQYSEQDKYSKHTQHTLYSTCHPFKFERLIGNCLLVSRHMPSLGAPFSPDLDVKPQLFMLTHDAKLIVVVGHWDNSFRVFSSAKGRMTQCIRKHTG